MRKIREERETQEKLLGKPTDFDKIMRGIGMCIWSWPIGEQEYNAFFVCSRLVKESGIDMPYPSLPFDEQPNLFFEFSSVYASAISDYFNYRLGETPQAPQRT